jgi:hypothetical protein
MDVAAGTILVAGSVLHKMVGTVDADQPTEESERKTEQGSVTDDQSSGRVALHLALYRCNRALTEFRIAGEPSLIPDREFQ